jgi:hypothetical protein
MLWTYRGCRIHQSGVLNNLIVGLHIIASRFFSSRSNGSPTSYQVRSRKRLLPFMLLPIYSVLVSSQNVKQAAHDIGANSRQTFLRVVFPLSMPGSSRIQLVFMPSLTSYDPRIIRRKCNDDRRNGADLILTRTRCTSRPETSCRFSFWYLSL